MRTALVFILILGSCLIKRDNHSCILSAQNTVRNSLAPGYPLKNITGSNHKRSPVDLFAVTACCDDDDEVEYVKKKTGQAVTLSKSSWFAGELNTGQRTTHTAIDHNLIASATYIFNRELLI